MNTETVTLSGGGIAVLVMGHEFEVPKLFAHHPQLHVMPVAELPDSPPGVANAFPPNTRVVMIGGELPRLAFGYVRAAAERKNVPLQHRRNQPALQDLLGKLLVKDTTVNLHPKPLATEATNAAADAAVDEAPPAPSTGTAGRPRGPLTALVVELANLGKGAAEEARRLFPIAQQRGIQTTMNSLTQAISKAKRKGHATGVPKSIQPASVKALDTLQDSIAGLQLLTEYISLVEKENLTLRAEKAELITRLKKALSVVQGLQELTSL